MQPASRLWLHWMCRCRLAAVLRCSLLHYRSGYVFDDHFDVFVEVAVRGAVIEKFSEIKHTSLTLTGRAREILQPYKL